jgi:uncharacterized protein (UPF0332 family)
MNKIKELVENRELRKVKVDKEKVEKSLEVSKIKLEESKRLFSAGFFDTAFLTLYTSMFHAARSLLYKDGFQEKSHFSVYIYLQERYSESLPKNLLFAFNEFRNVRHEILYGFEGENDKEETEQAILDAEEFLEEVEKLHGRK